MSDKSLSDTLKQTPMQYIKQGGQEFARFCVEKDSDAEKAIQGLLKQNDIKFGNIQSPKAGNTLRFAKEDGEKLEKIIKSIGSAEKAAAMPTGSTSPLSENEDQQTAEMISDSSISNENLLKAKEVGAENNKLEDAIEEIKDRADEKVAKESEKQEILPESAEEKGKTPQEKTAKLALEKENQRQSEIDAAKSQLTLEAILEGKSLAKVDKKVETIEDKAPNPTDVKTTVKEQKIQKEEEQKKEKPQKEEPKEELHDKPKQAGKKRRSEKPTWEELPWLKQQVIIKSGRPNPEKTSEKKSPNVGKQPENSPSNINDTLRQQHAIKQNTK